MNQGNLDMVKYPCVHASLSQDGFQRRGLWVALASLSIWPPRSFLGLLDFENMWPLISDLGRPSLLSCIRELTLNIENIKKYWYFRVPVHREGTPVAHSGQGWGGSVYLLPQCDMWRVSKMFQGFQRELFSDWKVGATCIGFEFWVLQGLPGALWT